MLQGLLYQRTGDHHMARASFQAGQLHVAHSELQPDEQKEAAQLLQANGLFENKAGNSDLAYSLVQSAVALDASLEPILRWRMFRNRENVASKKSSHVARTGGPRSVTMAERSGGFWQRQGWNEAQEAAAAAAESVLEPPPQVVSSAEDETALFALGSSLAAAIADLSCFSSSELDTIMSGAKETLLRPEVASETFGNLKRGRDLFETRRLEAATMDAKALEVAAAAAGAVRTDSGLVYQEIQSGSGSRPSEADSVRLHYHGTLVDGIVFDSSVDRRMPLQFEMSSVIPGWREGLARMGVGGKARLTIPSELGYGQRGMGPVPPAATLTYDIELLAITTDE